MLRYICWRGSSCQQVPLICVLTISRLLMADSVNWLIFLGLAFRRMLRDSRMLRHGCRSFPIVYLLITSVFSNSNLQSFVLKTKRKLTELLCTSLIYGRKRFDALPRRTADFIDMFRTSYWSAVFCLVASLNCLSWVNFACFKLTSCQEPHRSSGASSSPWGIGRVLSWN